MAIYEQPQWGDVVDQDLLAYMLQKSRWLCEKSRERIQRSRKSLAKADRFILEVAGQMAQFDSDYGPVDSSPPADGIILGRLRGLVGSWRWEHIA